MREVRGRIKILLAELWPPVACSSEEGRADSRGRKQQLQGRQEKKKQWPSGGLTTLGQRCGGCIMVSAASMASKLTTLTVTAAAKIEKKKERVVGNINIRIN